MTGSIVGEDDISYDNTTNLACCLQCKTTFSMILVYCVICSAATGSIVGEDDI